MDGKVNMIVESNMKQWVTDKVFIDWNKRSGLSLFTLKTDWFLDQIIKSYIVTLFFCVLVQHISVVFFVIFTILKWILVATGCTIDEWKKENSMQYYVGD